MLHWDYRRVSPDGVGTTHIINGIEGVGKALFNAIMSQTWDVEQGEVTLGNCALGGGKGSAQGWVFL